MASAPELAAAIREIQDRVRARHPQTAAGQIALADLMPIVHARDAAIAKVAAIGRLNPRRGGPLNSVIQSVKGLIARSLNWLVRDQVEFNRATMRCIEALLEAHNETNRALAEVAGRIAVVKTVDLPQLQDEAKQLQDIRSHWQEWRRDWERKLSLNEAQFLRAVSELQLSSQQRFLHVEQRFQAAESDGRDRMAVQHSDYQAALDRSSAAIQSQLWADFERMREETRAGFEQLLHHELRLLRQRPVTLPGSGAPDVPQLDWLAFADKFRGRAEDIRQRLSRYVPVFAGRGRVLDLGCGRGEFLSLVPAAQGVDLSAANVAICVGQNLKAEQADLFVYLSALPGAWLDGIFCGQVVEHLTPAQLPELIRLCAAKLKPGAPLVIETPNPESLAIFATHFFLDPTHTRPVPPALLQFYLSESGFRDIQIERLGTAANDFPELAQLPEAIRQRFFGSLDYAAKATRI